MPTITRENVESLTHGQTLYHMFDRGSDMRPVRARVNGRPQTWKRKPADFRLPMMHGLRQAFQIRNADGRYWSTVEAECPCAKSRSVQSGKVATLQS